MPNILLKKMDPTIHFEVTEVLLNKKSDFQSLQVLDTNP